MKHYKLRILLSSAGLFAGAYAAHPAMAMTSQAPIQIDGGPLGTLDLSGGVDGNLYATTGTGTDSVLGNGKTAGSEVRVGEIKIVKPTGLVQFTFDLKADDSIYLGIHPSPNVSTNSFTLGPVYAAYVTLAPNKAFSISAGQLYSLEGWESSSDWNNPNIIDSPLYYVENSSGRGVWVSVNEGPVSATVEYGDGFDSGVFNVVQGLVTYTFNSDNALSLYATTNLGRTGPNTFAYGGGTTGTGYPGYNAAYVNSTLFGGYYSYSSGNLTVVPEVQYIYSKPDNYLGLNKFTSNFGAEVMTDYQFGKSAWSLGTQAFYYDNVGPEAWYLSANSAGFGLGVTPTWQQGHIFARGEVGWLHLTNLGTPGSDGSNSPGGFGSSGTDPNQAIGVLEAGLVF